MEIRAVPVSEKVRVVGSQKVRDSVGSGSVRGGNPEVRIRVMISVKGSAWDDGPAARRRSWGMEMVSSTWTPGIPTSANPTAVS